METPVLWIVLGGLTALAIAVVVIYNGIVRAKNLALEGWSGIDVQLKRRADLIPSLLEVVKGYMTHERGLLEKTTEIRASAMKATELGERAQSEGALSGAVARIFAVAENYPDLKASQNFQELQASLSDTEEQIQLARRYYNGAARELNIKLQTFPSNLVAMMFRFQQMRYFEIENANDRATPDVAFGS